MSAAARSVYVWGAYLVVAGLASFIAPDPMLGLMGYPPSNEPWVRACGAVIAVVGYYYITAARNELLPMIRATVVGRTLVLGAYAVLVLVHGARWELLLLALPCQLGAIWTYAALRRPVSAPVAA
jgi:hypothetical protein